MAHLDAQRTRRTSLARRAEAALRSGDLHELELVARSTVELLAA